jgi:hypothetical protein
VLIHLDVEAFSCLPLGFAQGLGSHWRPSYLKTEATIIRRPITRNGSGFGSGLRDGLALQEHHTCRFAASRRWPLVLFPDRFAGRCVAQL